MAVGAVLNGQVELENRQRQREKLYTYIESICSGEAARQVEQLGVERQFEMRDHLFTRFGGGQTAVLRGRENNYLLGMPRSPNAPAFPERGSMPDKLDQLEAEREFFWDVCPKEKRDNYEVLPTA